MSDYRAIRKELNDLRKDLRAKDLALRGLDTAAMARLGEELANGHDATMRAIAKEARTEGAETAKRHRASLKFARRLVERDLRRAESSIGLAEFMGSLSPCLSPTVIYPVDAGSDVIEDDPGDGYTDFSVDFTTDAGLAKPSIEAISYSGTTSRIEVDVWLKFSFTPASDGVYCVTPVIQASGLGVMLVGLGCPDDPWDVGGSAMARLKIEVDQLSARVAEHWVMPRLFDQSAIIGGVEVGPFDYDSTVQGNAGFSASLIGGQDAVVTVRCNLRASALEASRARIDMRTSRHFYLSVPELLWGAPQSPFFRF